MVRLKSSTIKSFLRPKYISFIRILTKLIKHPAIKLIIFFWYFFLVFFVTWELWTAHKYRALYAHLILVLFRVTEIGLQLAV